MYCLFACFFHSVLKDRITKKSPICLCICAISLYLCNVSVSVQFFFNNVCSEMTIGQIKSNSIQFSSLQFNSVRFDSIRSDPRFDLIQSDPIGSNPINDYSQNIPQLIFFNWKFLLLEWWFPCNTNSFCR